MALPMTYSRRKRLREQDGQTLPFRTSPFGTKLLTQLFQIISQMNEIFDYDSKLFPVLVNYIRQEQGVISLYRANSDSEEFYAWFLSEMSDGTGSGNDLRLDAIELACDLVTAQGKSLDSRTRYSMRENSTLAAQLGSGLID